MARTHALSTTDGGMRLARFGPIDLRVDPSWFVWLLVIMFASAGFSPLFDGRPPIVRWGAHLGLAVAASACVVLHELAHSVVALAYGLPVRRITLFLFGGVSHIEREAPRASIEYQIAIAGPLTSLMLATIFGIVARQVDDGWLGLRTPWGFLAYVNLALAVFNLLPAFPMDGGRILRSLLWSVQRNRARATRWAGAAGHALAVLMITGGVALIVLAVAGGGDDPFAGVWTSTMGVFLFNAASAAVRAEGAARPNERAEGADRPSERAPHDQLRG